MKVTCFTSATTSCGSRIARTSRARLTALISLVLLLLLAACGGVEHPCIEESRTITHGIYGQATLIRAVDQTEPLKDVHVSISSGLDFVDLRTNDDGLFEAALPAGYYSVFSEFLMVGSFYVQTTDIELVRIDLRVEEGVAAYWNYERVGRCP